MSMNLYLIFKDKRGRWVNETGLIQTPTDVTMYILYDNKKIRSFEEQKRKYLKWVKPHWPEQVEDERIKINNTIAYWGDDYEPEFTST